MQEVLLGDVGPVPGPTVLDPQRVQHVVGQRDRARGPQRVLQAGGRIGVQRVAFRGQVARAHDAQGRAAGARHPVALRPQVRRIGAGRAKDVGRPRAEDAEDRDLAAGEAHRRRHAVVLQPLVDEVAPPSGHLEQDLVLVHHRPQERDQPPLHVHERRPSPVARGERLHVVGEDSVEELLAQRPGDREHPAAGKGGEGRAVARRLVRVHPLRARRWNACATSRTMASQSTARGNA